MTETTTGRRHRRGLLSRLRSRRLRAVLGLGLVLSLGVLGTHAYWTDKVTVVGVNLSTGRIDLKVNAGDTNVSLPPLVLSGMVPGNSVAAVVTVANAGTVPLKYVANGVATNADGKNLVGALVVKAVFYGSATGTAPARTCTGTAYAGTGNSLNGLLLPTSRQIDPGYSDQFCIEVSLPANASNTLQGATTSATLTFTGTSDLS